MARPFSYFNMFFSSFSSSYMHHLVQAMGKGSWKGWRPGFKTSFEPGGRYIRNGVILSGREEQKAVMDADATVKTAKPQHSDRPDNRDARRDNDDDEKRQKKKKGKRSDEGNVKVEERAEPMRKSMKMDTSFVADESLSGTPTMLYPGIRALHTSLVLIIRSNCEGVNLAISIGARVRRVKLSSMAVVAGDVCAYLSYQSDYQQREDLTFIQGVTNKMIYPTATSATVTPLKSHLAISNLNSFLLKLIGQCDSPVGTIYTLGTRNLNDAELPDPAPIVGDWDDPTQWRNLFPMQRYYPEGVDLQEQVSMGRLKYTNAHLILIFYSWTRGDAFK